MKVIFRKYEHPEIIPYVIIYPEYVNNLKEVKVRVISMNYTGEFYFTPLNEILAKTLPVIPGELNSLKQIFDPKLIEIVIPNEK